jgi:hypothetical protein
MARIKEGIILLSTINIILVNNRECIVLILNNNVKILSEKNRGFIIIFIIITHVILICKKVRIKKIEFKSNWYFLLETRSRFNFCIFFNLNSSNYLIYFFYGLSLKKIKYDYLSKPIQENDPGINTPIISPSINPEINALINTSEILLAKKKVNDNVGNKDNNIINLSNNIKQEYTNWSRSLNLRKIVMLEVGIMTKEVE